MHHVFVDSNVLGSKTKYDWLFLLRDELGMMFSLSTSDDVLDEAHRVWRRKHPEMGGEMRSRREELFRSNFDDISSDWDGREAPVVDVDDSHVHNAAAYLGADILLTDNVKDFGDPDDLPYELYTPDEFFCLIYKNAPQDVVNVTNRQAKYWERRRAQDTEGQPPKSLSEALIDAGCPEFAESVRDCLQLLSGVKANYVRPDSEVHTVGANV